jgi:hypothetical protein
MQPFADRTGGDCPARFVRGLQRSAVMIATHANMGLIFRTDTGKNVGNG